MQEIAKVALLGVDIPLPTVEEQRSRLNELKISGFVAPPKRAEVQTLRATACTAFDPALFSPVEDYGP
jgi:hypothetical protein